MSKRNGLNLKKLHLLLCLLFASTAFFYLPIQSHAQTFCATQITDNDFGDQYPNIDNGLIVWQTREPDGIKIYKLDLNKSPSEIQLVANTGFSDYRLDVSNGIIVWNSTVGADAEIFMYDAYALSPGVIQITNNDKNDKNPRVSNGLIVWETETDSWFHEVSYYDSNALSPTIITVTSSASENAKPRVADGVIVWRQNGSIFMYDTQAASPDTIDILNGVISYNSDWPEIADGVVVWQGLRDEGSSEIFMHDITKHTTQQISDNHTYDERPFVSNGIIVWSGSELFAYDLNSSNPVIETFGAGEDIRIDKGLATWKRYHDEQASHEIYSYDFYTKALTRVTQNYVFDSDAKVADGVIVWYGGDLGDQYDSEIYMSQCPVGDPPTIVKQPQSGVSLDGVYTFTVEAIGGGILHYQWYQGISGDTSQRIAWANSSSYTTPHIVETTSFWVKVYNELGFVNSETATMYKVAHTSIETQPKQQIIKYNQQVTMSVVATGPSPLTYQWYEHNTEDGSARLIDGATSSEYTSPPLKTSTGYWVKVSSPYETVNSVVASVIVLKNIYVEGFEKSAAFYSNWQVLNADRKDRIKCNTDTKSFTSIGKCIWQFSGSPSPYSKIQTIVTSDKMKMEGVLGGDDVLEFTYYTYGTTSTIKLLAKVRVVYTDKTLTKISMNYPNAMSIIDLEKDVLHIKIIFIDKTLVGKSYIDDVRLNAYPVGAPVDSLHDHLLPLPELFRD